MVIPFAPTFEASQIPEARKSFYDGFIQRTKTIASEFGGTKPTDEKKIVNTFRRIKELDETVGRELLIHDVDDLNVSFLTDFQSIMIVSNMNKYKEDPISMGLIVGLPIKERPDELIIFNSTVPGLFVKIKRKLDLSSKYMLTCSLIGKNDPSLKKES